MPTPHTGTLPADTGGLLTYSEAAAYLRVSDRTVRDEVRAGNLAAVRIGPRGGAVRISRAELDRYIAALPAYEPAS